MAQQGKRFLLGSEIHGTCGKVFPSVGVAIPPTVQQAEPTAPEGGAASSAMLLGRCVNSLSNLEMLLGGVQSKHRLVDKARAVIDRADEMRPRSLPEGHTSLRVGPRRGIAVRAGGCRTFFRNLRLTGPGRDDTIPHDRSSRSPTHSWESSDPWHGSSAF